MPNNATGAQMAAEVEIPVEIPSPTDGRRNKVQVLFYMNESVIKELKHRAVDQNKTYSQYAEDLIIAGLFGNPPQPTP